MTAAIHQQNGQTWGNENGSQAVQKPKPMGAVVRSMCQTSWGYGHIHGELKGLGYKVSWQTVRRVMLDHGLLPDPDKPYKST